MKISKYRSYRLIAVVACAGTVVACGKTSSSDETAELDAASVVADATPALPNRFADIAYPNAVAHDWTSTQEMYDETCGYCHGDHPAAGVGPELLGRGLPANYTILTVRNGRMGMPAFRKTDFTDAQLASLANMIEMSEAPVRAVPPGGPVK